LGECKSCAEIGDFEGLQKSVSFLSLLLVDWSAVCLCSEGRSGASCSPCHHVSDCIIGTLLTLTESGMQAWVTTIRGLLPSEGGAVRC
jgi:hypothetical protein